VRLAIIGTRGIPAAYGGFETFAEELSSRLASRGHKVVVYCRRGRVGEGTPPSGVSRQFLPMVPSKYLETISHTAVSVLHAATRRYDAILMVNAANAIFAIVPRLSRTPLALNVDGIERQRDKWGPLGKAWYSLSERLATILPNATISDARVIQDYYKRRYGHPTVMIPYGTDLLDRAPPPDLSALRLDPDRYVLYVSRLEPENNAHLVIEAYRKVPGDMPLAVVGDAPYASAYKARVAGLAAADPRVRLLGAIYGQGYRDLQRAARAYIQATEVGGTHPALIEAMGAGNVVFALGTPENREVTSGTAVLFQDAEGLARGLHRIVADDIDPGLRVLAAAARRRALEVYSWDAVAEAYEELLLGLTHA
jgi:glycosyltransferase involved in cell wall biosynthesis